jgi:hypothetical protein
MASEKLAQRVRFEPEGPFCRMRQIGAFVGVLNLIWNAVRERYPRSLTSTDESSADQQSM